MTDQTTVESEPAENTRFVVHLPFAARSLDEAKRYARVLIHVLEFLPRVDIGEATVSEEGDPGIHYRLICDRRLDAGRRCVLRADHESPCSARRRQLTNRRRI